MLKVIKITGLDTKTMEETHEVASRHRTPAAAHAAIERLARREQQTKWPHRPEMQNIIRDEYRVIED